MSLQEYTQLIEENNVVVARSSSFKDFNNRLEASTDQLAGLGIFGKTARDLSATMMTSATTLGVPQKELGSVVQSQIKTFQNLRDMTGMTADGFKQLVAEFSNMSEVQDQLLGMAPDQRAAAQADLLNSFTLGQQMGLTAQQSKALGSALLAQRKLTAVDRFKAAGTIRQAGAIAGMSSADTEELARLSQKKNKSSEEIARFAELGGNLQKRLEEMQNSGNISAENIADQLQAQFPGLTADALKQSGIAQLTKDSGQAQKNFTATTGETGQMLGKLATALDGFTKSPLYDALKGVGEIFIGFMAYKKGSAIVDAIANVGKAVPGVAATASKAASAATVVPKAASSLYGAGYDNLLRNNMLSAGGGKAAGAAVEGAEVAVGKAAGAAAEGAEVAVGKATKGIAGKIFGSLGKFLKGGFIISAIFGAVEELFTGNLGAATGSEALKDIDFGKAGWLWTLFGNVFSKLGDMLAGAIRGIATSVTDLADFVLNAIGVDTQELFGATLTNLFDRTFTAVLAGWEGFKSWLYNGLGHIAERLGLDSLGGWLSKKGDQAEEAKKKDLDSLERLEKDGSATLSSIGAAANKTAAATKKSADQIGVNSALVVNGLDGLASSAQSTVQSAQANMAKNQANQVATPGPTPVQNVNQPDVNTDKTQDNTAKQTSSTSGSSTLALGVADMIAVLQQQLDVAKQTLAVLSVPKESDTKYSRIDMPNTSSLTNAIFSGSTKSA
jgi:hypothetical protein